jgi:hypothetical protein
MVNLAVAFPVQGPVDRTQAGRVQEFLVFLTGLKRKNTTDN